MKQPNIDSPAGHIIYAATAVALALGLVGVSLLRHGLVRR